MRVGPSLPFYAYGRTFVWLLAMVLAILATGWTAARVAAGAPVRSADPMPPLASFDPRLVRALTLGHKSFYDDVVTLWMTQEFADASFGESSADRLERIVRRLLVHEPRFQTFYVYACFVLAAQFQRPGLCPELVATGMRLFPTSWRIPLSQAYVYTKVVKDDAKARAFYALAAAQPSCPPYFKDAALKLGASSDLSAELDAALTIIREATGGTDLSDVLERARAVPKEIP